MSKSKALKKIETATMAKVEALLASKQKRTPAEVVSELKGLLWCKGGIDCFLCDRHVEIRKKHLNRSLVKALVRIYAYFEQADAEEWLHVANYLAQWKTEAMSRNGDFTLLRRWGLIEAKRRIDKKDKGLYRITELGRQFLRGEVTVPAFKFLYNSKVLEPDHTITVPLVTVHDVIDGRFDYRTFVVGTLRSQHVRSTPRLKLFKFPKSKK